VKKTFKVFPKNFLKIKMGRKVCYLTRPNKKKLYIRRRHLGLSALDRIKVKDLKDKLKKVCLTISLMENGTIDGDEDKIAPLKMLMAHLYKEYWDIIGAPDSINMNLPRIISLHRSIDSFIDEDIPNNFRFSSKEQLRRLIVCFQMPDEFRSKYRHVFRCEELLLVVLFYLHFPHSSTDLTFKSIFGWDSWKVNLGVKLFMGWFIKNWSYLIYDNMAFWVDSFPMFAEKIRYKLELLNCFFPQTNGCPGTFNVTGFIDNTVYATCRPGGGPTKDGPDSPRYHPLFQRSYYNGWKSTHGIKWQTIGLPNGMMFHAWGPVLPT